MRTKNMKKSVLTFEDLQRFESCNKRKLIVGCIAIVIVFCTFYNQIALKQALF